MGVKLKYMSDCAGEMHVSGCAGRSRGAREWLCRWGGAREWLYRWGGGRECV